MQRGKIIYLIILSVMMCSCKWMAAGSYPFVESYNIPLKEDLVIDEITKFKAENTQFNMPDSIYNGDTKLDLKDGRDGLWYMFDFYDKERDQILSTWVRESGKNDKEATFALVSIKKDARTGKWQRVNDDLKGKENKAAIARFETLILEPIRQRLQPLLPDGRTIENNGNW